MLYKVSNPLRLATAGSDIVVRHVEPGENTVDLDHVGEGLHGSRTGQSGLKL